MKKTDGSSGQDIFPLQLPEHVLEYLITKCKLEIDDALVERYWEHLTCVGDTLAVSSKQFREGLEKPVWALGLYGDEACMGLINAPKNQILGIYMSIVHFRPTATRLSRWLLFSIESAKYISMEATIYPVLEKIVESFNWLTDVGIGGRHFLVSELRGDQKYFYQVFKHKSWWKGTQLAWICFHFFLAL